MEGFDGSGDSMAGNLTSQVRNIASVNDCRGNGDLPEDHGGRKG